MPAVVIVGAGVMGASTAWHLASRGCRDVLLLDRGPAPGAGSTSRATGGFRAQYPTGINVRLSLLAREKLRRFGDEVGGECGYEPRGYLWLASSDEEMAALAEARIVQHAEGLEEAHSVSPGDIARLNPAVDLQGIVGGAYCPSDGFIRPLGILNGYLKGARRLGVTVNWNVEVTGLARDGAGRVTGVATTTGDVSCDLVVNACGAWAGELGRVCGVDLPVAPLRRQVACTVATDVLPAEMPMTIFIADGFHLRVRDGRVLLLWPTPGVPGDPFAARVDDRWISDVSRRAHARVPVLRGVPIDREACWAGLYEMSPDRHAILGPAVECANVYLINGSSGHGVMHAPALGQLLSEMILDGAASTLDVSALRPSRFAAGEPNPVSGWL